MPTTGFTKPYQHSLTGATLEGKLELISSTTLYRWLTERKAKPPYRKQTSIKRHALPVSSQKEIDPLSKF
ncbi:hypothetical protein CsSME_00015845 [Camellia sinensis var. sinensis]